MIGHRRKKFTLMPLIALGALSLAVAVPVLSTTTIHAAAPVRYSTVTVRPGDNIWSLAEARSSDGADIQDVVDNIIAVNHIGPGGLTPGQQIRVPR